MSVFAINGDILHPLTSLACYASGVIVGSLLTRNVQPQPEGSGWPRQISLTLLIEAAILICAEVVWSVQRPSGSFHPQHDLLLGCVGFAMGMQSAAMLKLKIPGIATTYISGTWTTFMSGLTRLRDEPADDKQKFESRLGMQAVVLAAYFVSAVVTGCLFRYVPVAVGALPALSALLVAIYCLRAKS